jgi:hypothetical protein
MPPLALLLLAPLPYTSTATMTASKLPNTHREYRVTGSSKTFDSLELKTEAATPTPKADEVLVRMRAVSLNNRDLQVRISRPAHPLEPDADIVPPLLRLACRTRYRSQIANGTYPAPFETNVSRVSSGKTGGD